MPRFPKNLFQLHLSSKGFTLIELLIVITILGVISVIGAVIYSSVQNGVKESRKKSDVQAIIKAYENKYAQTGSYGTGLIESSYFISGAMPKTPEGGDYTIFQDSVTKGVAACTVLSGNQEACSQNSATCFCNYGSREYPPDTSSPNVEYLTNSTLVLVNPNNIPNCVLWISADSGVTANSSSRVSSWANQCSGLSSVVQANSSLQPTLIANVINGKPVVRFNLQSMTATSANTQIGSIFMVLRWTGTLPPSGGLNYNHPGPGGFDNTGSSSPTYQSGNMGAIAAGTSNFGANTLIPVNPQVTNRAFIAILNNRNVANVSKYLIGARDPNSSYWNGDIAEIIIYNRALSGSEIQQIRDYLSSKYNIF